ncbi:hypothetical protein GTQ99_16965 [Kineococcus sp. T13]|uniref:hypothetical protein n=1 Tax=Kineococcus vitellinus TaxID=2696565 RepID=UPI0014127B13|nr:hypothetical protein [Kineococcus vitellinus]NAZ77098.1 hypothetical protein [Kineococcus vitellinus]
MQIPKEMILQLIREKFNDDGKAQEADAQLPGQVDTDQHADLLSRFGVDPGELIAKFTGGGGGDDKGGGLGGLAGKIGL